MTELLLFVGLVVALVGLDLVGTLHADWCVWGQFGEKAPGSFWRRWLS